jgi:uncharacterized membrane protein YkoI
MCEHDTTLPALSPEESPAPVETAESEVLKMRETESFMSTEEPVKYIGVDAALEAALNHAEVKKQDAEIIGVVRAKDADGKAVYQVGFRAGELGYDYTLDAVSGEIDSYTVTGLHVSDSATFAASFGGEVLTEQQAAAKTEEPAVKEPISEEEAMKLALAHASVKAGEVIRKSAELINADKDSDSPVYHLEFRTATKSFVYEINAASGEILSAERK